VRLACVEPADGVGPIAVAYNVNGLTSLNLNGATAANIFDGDIKTWNDPEIQAVNLGVTLPAEPIRVVFRSDESGTTDNFQNISIPLPMARGPRVPESGKRSSTEVSAREPNDGAAAAVKSTEGSISYVEWSFAQAQHLNTAKVVASAGPDPVAISTDSVGKTISAAFFMREGNDLALDTISFYRPNQPGSYPIVLATYEIVCSKYPGSQVGTAVKAFLQSTIGAGQNGLADNGYVPIPDGFKSRLSTAVNAIS
jgi:phosphate transport system substrate-binding protein